MTVYCGIDPGFTGAIAYYLPEDRELIVHDMPVAPNPKGKTELNLPHLGEILNLVHEAGPLIAMLEQVAARPGQGAPATFRFGQGYGAIEMALTGTGWERHYVTPAVWKQHFKLSKDKGVSRSLAARRFPHHASLFSRAKDDGRAEAALLALYAYETVQL